VSRIGNPLGAMGHPTLGFYCATAPCAAPADCQSAKQQVANLRYAFGGLATSEFGFSAAIGGAHLAWERGLSPIRSVSQWKRI
jgi:hypothetical protein